MADTKPKTKERKVKERKVKVKPPKAKGGVKTKSKFSKKKTTKVQNAASKARRVGAKRSIQLPSGEFKVSRDLLGRKMLIPTITSFRRFKLAKKQIQRAPKPKPALKPGEEKKVKKNAETPEARKARNAERVKALKAAGPGAKRIGVKKRKLPTHKKLPIYYPTIDKPKKRKSKKIPPKPKKIRASIRPGTILILVAGRHRGKRVVFLKGLKSGLLLVTGPFKLNACPMRRISQKYVIATKTQLNINKVKLPSRIRDAYFKRRHQKRPRKDDGEIFEAEKETYKLSEKRKQDQVDVDTQVLTAIRGREDKKMLFRYLAAPFSLRNRVYPHKLVF